MCVVGSIGSSICCIQKSSELNRSWWWVIKGALGGPVSLYELSSLSVRDGSSGSGGEL